LRWLADECVHAPVVRHLREAGHDVVYMPEIAQRTKDTALAADALRANRILLTEDKDFGEIARASNQMPGTVLLRFIPSDRDLKWPQLREAIAQHGNALQHAFTVVEKSRIRCRPLGSHDGMTS
jgi:predicted nuclease of predicted toxin-antitoxin system